MEWSVVVGSCNMCGKLTRLGRAGYVERWKGSLVFRLYLVLIRKKKWSGIKEMGEFRIGFLFCYPEMNHLPTPFWLNLFFYLVQFSYLNTTLISEKYKVSFLLGHQSLHSIFNFSVVIITRKEIFLLCWFWLCGLCIEPSLTSGFSFSCFILLHFAFNSKPTQLFQIFVFIWKSQYGK